MLTLIDNYDSFTFNLVQFLGDLGADCQVVRNDKATPEDILAAKPQAIILCRRARATPIRPVFAST